MDIKVKRKVRILAVFLIVMVLCTILSRAAASILVAQVEVGKPGRGRLSYTSSGSGTVVPVQENMVFLWPGQQVEWAAEVGSTVKAGECLVQFRMEYLQQTIESKQAELTQLELQAGQQQISARGTVRVPSAERAGQTLADAQRQLQEAQQRAAEAQAAYEQFQAGQSAAVQSQSAYVVTDSANDIPQPSNPSPSQQELENAFAEAQANVEVARQAVIQAQNDYNFALKEDAAQDANEANAVQSAQLGVQALNAQADTARKALEQLVSYQNAGGKICAEQDCTILTSGIQAGAFTTGSEVLITGNGGWKLKGQVAVNDKEKIRTGVEAEIRLGTGSKRTVKIESIGAESVSGASGTDVFAGENGVLAASIQTFWYAPLPENTAANHGDSFDWTVRSDSGKEYEQLIPLSALREDADGAYCLIVSEEESMLGTVQTAKRVSVTVLEKDSENAAVTSTLKDKDQIIISSEKYVGEGDRVRIK